MKRFCCVLLALCLLGSPALAEENEDWELFESRFGFTLWYSQDQLTYWEDDFEGEAAECFCPWEDHSGVAVLICTGSRFSSLWWEDQTPITLDETDIWLEYPYEMTAYTDGDVITEQWIISVADGDFVFLIQYEVGDYQGWAPLFHSVLETLEFPNQPAVNADFRLDFFQGGAAGMRFIDVVVDAEADALVLLPLRDVHDFSLDYLEWDASGDWMDWKYSATPLYTAQALSPGDNLRIFCYIPDALPNLRIVYAGEDGEYFCFLLSQSGRDGSLLFLEDDL